MQTATNSIPILHVMDCIACFSCVSVLFAYPIDTETICIFRAGSSDLSRESLDTVQRKLIAATMGPVVIALLLALAAMRRAAPDEASQQRALERAADIAGATAADDVRDGNSDAARRNIIALRSDPAIASVAAYGTNGQLFAGWSREGVPAPPKQLDQIRNAGSRSIEVFRPIRIDGDVLGSIYVAADAPNVPLTGRVSLRLAT